jgi:uncharacterized membrane protein YphA (DoxX/SURF4 family)
MIFQAIKSLHRLWNAYWFAPGRAENLALTRIASCLFITVFAVPPLKSTVLLIEVNPEFLTPRPIISLLSVILGSDLIHSTEFWVFLHWITVIAGILSTVGLFTRLSVGTFAIGFLSLVSHFWSYGELHHPRIAACWFLIILAFSRCSDCLSVDCWLKNRSTKSQIRSESKNDDGMYTWPVRLILASIAFAYFHSGLWKIFYQGGIDWINGYTLRFYLLAKDFEWGPALFISQSLLLCSIISIIAIAFELFFPLAIIFPKKAKWFILLAALFHLGNWILRKENPLFLLYPLVCIGSLGLFSAKKAQAIKTSTVNLGKDIMTIPRSKKIEG